MKKGPTPATTKAPLPPAQGKTFNAGNYVRPGVSEADILDIKAAFDLFDTDQGGSIDTNCNYIVMKNSKQQWSPLVSKIRMQSFSK